MNRRLVNKSILMGPFGYLLNEDQQYNTIKIGNDSVKIPEKWELRNIKYNQDDAVINVEGDFRTCLNANINGIPTCRTVIYHPNDSRFQETYIVPFTLCLNKDSFMEALHRSADLVEDYNHGLILYMKDLNLYGFIVSTPVDFKAPFKLLSEKA